MDLSIILVNWNAVDYLLECLASIYDNTRGIEFEIIVVDNASPQGGIEIIGERYPAVRMIKSPTNVGFAKANNIGFEHSTGSYVLFLNPDTVVLGGALAILLENIMALPDTGIVGCKMLNSDRTVQITSIQRLPTILNQAINAEHLQLKWPNCPLWSIGPLFTDPDKPVRVEVISGACMLLRREVFAQVGMFSEDYFMYAEDLDLNYKLRQAGYSNYYIGNASIIHHGGRSSSQQKVSQWSTIMKYRAMTRYYRKTRGRPYELAYRATMGVAAAGRLVLLGIASISGDLLWKKEHIRYAADKWKTVLKWAVGWQDVAV
jgi:GT2 family glycosyltransferase